jgi:hypothetical protein
MAQPSHQTDRSRSSAASGPAPEGSRSAEAWKEHEHISGPVQDQAQKLIQSAGSPQLARQALEAAEREQASPVATSVGAGAPHAASRPHAESGKDQFARQHGFRSYLELFEASTSMSQSGGKNWFVTGLPSGKWICWNEQNLEANHTFSTFEEACACVPPQGTSVQA